MLKTFGLHCIFVLDAMRSIWATPFFRVLPLSDFCILAQEGPRDFSNIAKKIPKTNKLVASFDRGKSLGLLLFKTE